MSYCPKHSDKAISWVCLDINCESRVMCNVCAVKTHNRNHRVEELENIQKCGFINIYFDSQDEFQQSVNDELNELENLQKTEDIQDVVEDLQQLFKNIEEKIKTLLYSFTILQQSIQMTQQNEYQKLKLDKAQAVQKLFDIQQNIQQNVSEDYLTSQINEAILIVNDKLKKKIQNPSFFNIQRKKELLAQIKKDFLKLSKLYFENKFTMELCNMFDIQIDALSQEQNPSIMNENKFIDFVNKKQKKDFNVLLGAIELSTQKLNQVLKYTLDENNISRTLQQQYLQSQEQAVKQNQIQNNTNLYEQQQQQYQQQQYFPPIQQVQSLVYADNYPIINETYYQNTLPIHQQSPRIDQYHDFSRDIRFIQKR